ncbi:MAG: FkbM family methyltransferase [Arenicella sp.]|jgi:FkbM family methyltransferase
MLKNKIGYHWSKLAPFGSNVKISLKNGTKFIVRARTMDRSVVKEVWLKEIYNQHGISVQEGDTVLDIGGHIGVFNVYAAQKSKTGKVYSFEPFSENFERLKMHAEINKLDNVSLINKGVSSITGKQTLNLSPDNNTGGHSLHLKTETDKKVEIDTITLSDFYADAGITKVDFLKLDCEGAEFDIVKGNLEKIKEIERIILECHPYGDNTVDQMIELLSSNGFDVKSEKDEKGEKVQMLYAKRK